MKKKKGFPLNLTNFRTCDGSNFFHFLIQDIALIDKFHEEYMKAVHMMEDEDEKRQLFELYLLILAPNNVGLSPFDLAVKYSAQYVEQCLKML